MYDAAYEHTCGFMALYHNVLVRRLSSETCNNDHKSCKASWVKWNNVLTSRDKEGLGVVSLYALNRGLMFKWILRFYSQKSSLWTRVIKAIHGDDGKLDKDVIVGGQTCWTSIVKEARSLKGTGINVVDLIRLKYFWSLESEGDYSVASIRKLIDEKRLQEVKESEEKMIESESENARKIEVLLNKISELEAKECENEEKISLLVEKLEESDEKERVKSERIDALMEKLKESENKISELESEGNNKNIKVNEMLEKLDQLQKEIVSKEDVVETSTSSTNWPVIAVSAGAVGTLALVYFRHAKF
nr:RNA-directed DNA polymerase, eukaryota, reverse transcriptase zinc-binding domain protein [Tanacetum cinerariifolium]